MRRKLFILLLATVTLLMLLYRAGVPLRTNEISLEEYILPKSTNEAAKNTETKEKEEYNSDNGIECVGKVIRIREKEGKHTLRVRLTACNGIKADFCEDILISVYKDLEQPWELLHSSIAFTAELRDADGARNPHCFDYYTYLKSCGIGKIATVAEYEVSDSELSVFEKYERLLYRSRCEFLEGIGSENRGIIAGVLFGDSSYMEEEIYEEFRNNGTAHILAVSGLHVGILYGIYKKLAGRRRTPGALLVLLALLITYGTLSMWSPSATRAILMITVSTVGRLADRRYDRLTGMSVAAFILIADNPYVILGTGFQMSFLAISSITFFTPLVSRRIPEGLATAMAVNFGLLFYQIQSFNYISLVSLLVNIPIIYLTGYFVPIAMLTFVLSCAGVQSTLMYAFTEGFAMLLTKLNHFSTLGGLSSLDVVSLPQGVMIFILCISFFAASETFLIWRLRKNLKNILCMAVAIVSVSVIAQVAAYSPITHDNIVFVDVGQGDCIQIRADGKNILIDGGGKSDYNLGKKTLKPYLLKNGVASVDAALATHKHTDHYKGLTELAECMRTGEIFTDMTAGKTVRLSDSVWIEVLWPLEISGESTQDENKNCSVFMIHYDGIKILVTGDLDSEGEKEMLSYYDGSDTMSADVLKVGHHGSKYSTCEEFLSIVNPKLAVIQVGSNTYGHPTQEVLDRLNERGCKIYRNDINGAVGLRIKKNKIEIHTVL